MPTEVQILAKDTMAILLRDGWKQGSCGLEYRPHCLVGAMIFTEQRNGRPARFAYLEFKDAVKRAAGDSPPLEGWNDQSGRTFDEVRAVLAAVANDD